METSNRNNYKGLFLYIPFLFLLFWGLILPDISNAQCTPIQWGTGNGWQSKDNDGARGSQGASTSGDQLTLNAYGDDMWSSIDEYFVYYQNDKTGDFDVQVKVVDQDTTSSYNCGTRGNPQTCTYDLNSWAKSGIIVKNDLSTSGGTSGQGYCMIAITPGNGVIFATDGDGNGYLGTRPSISGVTAPVWLRIVKYGSSFTGYYKVNESDSWTQVGGTLTPGGSVATSQDVGVFVSAYSSSINNNTVFSDFRFDEGACYSITATAGANGTITSDSTTVSAGSTTVFTVSEGYSKTFTIDPNTGYNIGEILVDGTVYTPPDETTNTYTFDNVTADHTISATFVPVTYTIDASAGAGGSISPSGPVSVEYSNSQAFTISPDLGHQISQVLVDGVDETSGLDISGDTYTFSSVAAGHAIAVTFCAATYTITTVSGSNGSISPSGSTTLTYGASQTYTVTPDSGYYASVTVDGASVVTNATEAYEYTFTSIASNHTIRATFSSTATVTEEIAGCDTSVSSDYSGGFVETDFELENLLVVNGQIVLETGAAAIDPNSIVIPFDQEVAVTFLYEGAGYVSDFGYMLLSDAVDSNGNFLGWTNIANSKKHMIYHNIHDENNDGILDAEYGNGGFPISSETSIAAYNDGSATYPGISFVPDGDGAVTNKDMRKVLGTFEAGSELVFFLTADKDWNTTSTTGVFFTKKAWNPDTYTACTPATGASYTDCSGTTSTNFNRTNNTFRKIYNLGEGMAESTCSLEKGWLMQDAIDRMSSLYGITLSGTYDQCLRYGYQYEHVIVGAPPEDPNQWILGWEDLTGAGDSDFNDMAFRIERKTGGLATLQSSAAPVLASGSYYTAATIDVYDYMPCAGSTRITYWVSIDGGGNWLEITDWDAIYESSASQTIGAEVTNWTPGTPEYTYRTYRIDFAGLGMTGNTLIWKAQLQSQDEACQPSIINVSLSGTVATNGSFSRSSPVVQTNMMYSGSYETPSIEWTDKTVLRGHMKATRIYDPANPDATAALEIWDAGAVLAGRDVSTRSIYFPDVTIIPVTGEVLATGDGATVTFTGTLAYYPVLAESVAITNTIETFVDIHTDELEGSNGGTGTINRFTGAYTITFNTPPGSGVPITASYTYYTTSSALQAFNTANVSSDMLGLDNSYVIGNGFNYDLNNDGKFNNVSYLGSETPDDSDGDWLVNWVRGYKDGSSIQKQWVLGPVDHSTPAIQTPPGMPSWYYGSDITEDERTSFDTFREANATRRTVAYIGARDGMIHAFDAGQLHWGDNPRTTSIEEQRGYFEWDPTGDSSTADYGDGSELWSFIPANLISRLKNNLLQAEDQSYVDASPTLADVTINGAWRTILVCAEGNGGDTVFALDVTNTYSPTFLWEFADPDLFRSRSSPTVGLGRIVLGGQPQWVAIFVSGKTSDPNAYPSLYIVSVDDGHLIERVYLDAALDGVGGVPSGQPAIADSDGNGFIDRLYIGTDKGYLYKVNLPDDPDSTFSTITNCVLNDDFTDEDGNSLASDQLYHPVYASPSITIENTMSATGEIEYKIVVFFGTGDSPYYDEDINTAGTTYHFFVYVDNEDKGMCGTSSYLDWFYELPAGERVWASAYSAAGQIYFGTATAETEDPCEATAAGANEGKLYVFTTSGSRVATVSGTGNIVTTPVVEDEHVYFRTSGGLNSIGGSTYNNAIRKIGTGSSSIISWEEITEIPD